MNDGKILLAIKKADPPQPLEKSCKTCSRWDDGECKAPTIPAGVRHFTVHDFGCGEHTGSGGKQP